MKGSSLTIQTSSFRRNNRCSEEERQLRSQHHSTVADDSETPTDATDEDEVSITTLKAKKKRKMETSWMDELFESTDIQMWSTVPNKKPVEPLAGTPTKHTHSGKSSPRTQSSQSTRSSSPTREELMIMFPERRLLDHPIVISSMSLCPARIRLEIISHFPNSVWISRRRIVDNIVRTTLAHPHTNNHLPKNPRRSSVSARPSNMTAHLWTFSLITFKQSQRSPQIRFKFLFSPLSDHQRRRLHVGW
ncbi:hypothetical protein BLNAU_20553 [Blattamonas nauphoetae]|uniref:Uncharacterized protein n=1 Tax=Blattamonas nauphoetae TaxID=2049346 RepID=A0ABQ9X0S8_9EUKA|nr:hypothetical protein BLNAU_20709 [Blattamonas nauphoetae]KAK2944547.1 hypothetical protein BLNAU_20553 [Blattamonas nauphoetae]